MTERINNYSLTDAFLRQADRVQSNIRGENDRTATKTTASGETFQQLLDKQIGGALTFSKHAAMRTEQRNVEMNTQDLSKLSDACQKAERKGIKEALIVMNNSAFIVNTPNKVVVTVVDKTEMTDNVFTNIDGALFI